MSRLLLKGRRFLFLSSQYKSSFQTNNDCNILCRDSQFLTRPNYFYILNNCSFSSSIVKMSEKTALVVIANGSEEMEAVITIDVLRRAGVEVTVAGLVDENAVLCSRQVKVVPDVSFSQAVSNGQFDAIILPGGLGGAASFAKSAELGEALKKQEEAGRVVAAICAAPTALKQHGIGLGKAITSYPSLKDEMVVGNQYDYKDESVVVDGNLITSRGPGTAIEFGLALVDKLVGKGKADEVAKGMLVIRQ